MAIAETVLGAVLAVVFDKLASQEVINLFRRSKIDLEELRRLMSAAEKLLLDAEEKQRTEPPVKEWLDELQHWFFRAEEVIDQIATKAVRSSLTSSHGTPSRRTKVRKFIPSLWSSISFSRRITRNISEIVSALQSMLARNGVLGLRELSGCGAPLRVSRATTSVPEDSQVYGRDQEKEKLTKFLFSKEAEESSFRIGAIVGMGGIGKTTLAKMIFNDETVQETFEVKAWVCVSDQFDIDRVTKSILDSITGHGSESADLNVLQNKLRRELMNKKFLLVLDDVWNEDYHGWGKLRAPFSAGTSGSRIIVTTRKKNVADIMRANPIFPLELLSDDDGWSLFSRHAFEGGNLMCNPCLEDIGRKIVRKCGGLPLAIEVLAGLLGTSGDIEYWKEILHSNLWGLPHDNNVIPALWLSYYYLPGHLKRCFSYCAVFPKDYEIDRKQLVLFWMAENFLSHEEKIMEEKGSRYIDDLVSGSFLEPVDELHVKMHDLMHDLAQGVLSNLLATPELETPSEFTRHFSYTGDHFDVTTKFQAIEGKKYLRSFLKLGTRTRTYFPKYFLTGKVPSIIEPSFSCLRVLSLSGYENLRMPESVPKQLRYLDVSGSKIKQLPKWVSTLCNLQTLILSNCRELEKLPDDMWRLVSLRHLDIRGASSVSHMPTGMGELKDLRTLTDFVVGKDIGSCIKELSELQEIRGKFAIRHLQNVASPRDAWAVNLRNRKFIDDLELEFDHRVPYEECREVLENLNPHSDVKRLTIRGYGGATLPKWLSLGCAEYKEIKFLCLSNCRYCSSLPPLGQLPSLKELTIKGMNGIQQVGHEFYGHDVSSSFPSLESLTFENLKGWEVWSNIGADGGAICLPRLKMLCLTDCPNLRGNLPVHVPSLVALYITECVLLKWLLPRVPAARVLVLQQASCPCPLAELPNALVVTSITKLSLAGLEGLEYLPTELVMLSSLSVFSISECVNLRSLADVQLPPSLKFFAIWDCYMLESLSKDMESLTHLVGLKLSRCERLICFPGSSLPTSLSSLEVCDCNRWEFPISIERMKHTCLEFLELKHTSEHLVSFPLGIFPNLRSLSLTNCKGLKKVYIPEGIEDDRLASLCELSIGECDALEMIGKETGRGEAATELPAPNLTSLWIFRCEKVKPVVVEREGEVLLPNLQSLYIENSASRESPHSLRRSLFKFSCLTGLSIEGLKAECFPVAGEDLPTSLTWLRIWNFRKLRKLDGEALLRLKYLAELEIWGCPQLERLPKGRLPPSLGELVIKGCPKLEERYKSPEGKDWSKIRHIPHIDVGGPWEV